MGISFLSGNFYNSRRLIFSEYWRDRARMKVELDQVKVLNAWARSAYVMFGTVAFFIYETVTTGAVINAPEKNTEKNLDLN